MSEAKILTFDFEQHILVILACAQAPELFSRGKAKIDFNTHGSRAERKICLQRMEIEAMFSKLGATSAHRVVYFLWQVDSTAQ